MINRLSEPTPHEGTHHNDLESARHALTHEIRGLEALRHALGTSFVHALDVMIACTGRVVVSGIGKSGHIARKIAATLASTGTPSFFIHPTEASHGDLGMISMGDCLLVLSNSGETAELADMLSFSKRRGLPLIGVTQKASSSLAAAATVTLLLPPAVEACPMGLAPTTSTTMMLALGDALAVTLLNRRGFTSEQFRSLHPGGTLGRKLLHVSDIMRTGQDLPLVDVTTPVAEALVVIAQKAVGCVGVQSSGHLIGIITDGDLRRHLARKDLLTTTVDSIMTANPMTIRPGALAVEALHRMNDAKITTLFVTDPSTPEESPATIVGLLHVHDCLRAGLA